MVYVMQLMENYNLFIYLKINLRSKPILHATTADSVLHVQQLELTTPSPHLQNGEPRRTWEILLFATRVYFV